MDEIFNISLSVVIPALNEGNNLKLTVDSIVSNFRDKIADFEILVFDDNSTDNTAAVAEQLVKDYPQVKTFHNSQRKNIGGIYKQGLKLADKDYFMLITGDNEVIVEELIPAFGYLKQSQIIVFYHNNEHIRSFSRQLISALYTKIINFLFFSDFIYTNDTNIYKKSLLDDIKIKADGFSYQTEALIKTVKKGNDFIEFGKKIAQRKYGKSKSLSFSSFLEVTKSIFRLWWEVMVSKRGQYCKSGKKLLVIK